MQDTPEVSFLAASPSAQPLLTPRQELSHGYALELREIPSTDSVMIERIGELRVRAWQAEVTQPIRMVTWLDDFDSAARHWVILRDGKPVAAARLSVHSSIEAVPESETYAGVFTEQPAAPIASFNRLVVDPTSRGMGLSREARHASPGVCGSDGMPLCRSFHFCGAATDHEFGDVGLHARGTRKPYRHPPACYAPPPVIMFCHLPRPRQQCDSGLSGS